MCMFVRVCKLTHNAGGILTAGVAGSLRCVQHTQTCRLGLATGRSGAAISCRRRPLTCRDLICVQQVQLVKQRHDLRVIMCACVATECTDATCCQAAAAAQTANGCRQAPAPLRPVSRRRRAHAPPRRPHLHRAERVQQVRVVAGAAPEAAARLAAGQHPVGDRCCVHLAEPPQQRHCGEAPIHAAHPKVLRSDRLEPVGGLVAAVRRCNRFQGWGAICGGYERRCCRQQAACARMRERGAASSGRSQRRAAGAAPPRSARSP